MTYDFDTVVDRRGTSSLKWDYEEMFVPSSKVSARMPSARALLPLWVADMDFVAPPEIMDALRRRVEHGVFGYTLEPDSWFEAAADWVRLRHSWALQREWMLASPGVIPSLVVALLALTQPGDGVVIQPPVYYPFALRVRAHGRRVVENPLRLSGTRWDMDLDGLERLLEDETTRMVVLCSPHNPVGRVWDRGTLARLAAACARRNVIIVSDEIHCDLVMPGHRHQPIASVSDEAATGSVTLMAASKTFNLAGLGGSLTIIPDPGLRQRFQTVQRGIVGGAANAVTVTATEAAWRHGGPWLDQLLLYLSGNYRFLVRALAEKLPAVRAFPLEGTCLPLLDMRALHLPDDAIRERLLGAARVWLDEGSMFGTGGEGFQRINIGCPRSVLAEAIDRMAQAFSAPA